MKSKKVLFITQEMIPYVPESAVALDGRQLPQALQEKGCEIRTFMPRWGIINERRNQLHEVIRLSGMNIIIDDIAFQLFEINLEMSIDLNKAILNQLTII